MEAKDEPVIEQVCFPTEDGKYMLCNCVMRNGVCVTTTSGKWWKFPYQGKRKPKKNEEGASQTATASKRQ